MWPAARLNCHGEVDLTPVEFLKQATASVTHERHSHSRPGLLEPSQNRWCVGTHDVRRHAKPNLALECRCAHQRPDLVIVSQQPVSVRHETLAMTTEAQTAPVPLKKLTAKRLFQAFHLQADGCLREVENARGACHAACFGHRSERSQQR